MLRPDLHKCSLGVNFNGREASVMLWAPGARRASVLVNDTQTIELKLKQGYWSTTTKLLQRGDQYQFVIDDKKGMPDPASLSQPKGVHGASEAIDLTGFSWTDRDWINPPLNTYIFYELHTGTFAGKGDFNAIAKKVPYLKKLGITAVELMPVGQFPGSRNWGYDGVFPFAVQNSYGGAAELQALVNICHEQGIAVVLDVVYNHVGPEGNYFRQYGQYFTDKYKTPWGDAVNFDDACCDAVRRYVIENALMWFRDFHIDALRLDAVHAIKDFSPVHILRELRQYVDQLSNSTGKQYYLIAECDLNDPRFIDPLAKQGYGMHAQWCDEFHHTLRVAGGQKREGYYSDFNGVADLGKSYKTAYVYDGLYSAYRKKTFGLPALDQPGEQFVVFSQNHDQVGNRMKGERSSELVSFSMQKLMAGAVLLSPYLPLLFMGEEWAAPSPFQYFVSHSDPAIVAAVKKGRRQEFKTFKDSKDIPDPFSVKTFKRSKLAWGLLSEDKHSVMFSYYQALIAIRKKYLPLDTFTRQQCEADYNCFAQSLRIHRWFGERHIYLFMNFSKTRNTISLPYAETSWHKLLYSEENRWKGQIHSPDLITGNVQFFHEPESIYVYSSHA